MGAVPIIPAKSSPPRNRVKYLIIDAVVDFVVVLDRGDSLGAIAVVPRSELVHPKAANHVVANLRDDHVSEVSLGQQSHQFQHRSALLDDCKHGVAERVLQSRSPRVVQFLERGHNTRRDLVDQCWIATRERVEGHRELTVASVKKDHVVRAMLRHQSQDRSGKVAVRINETDTATGFNVGMDLVLKQRRLAHSRFADNVKMAATIFLRYADDATVIAKSNLTDDDRPLLSS